MTATIHQLPVRTGDPAPQSPGDARLLAAARARGYGSAREMFRAHSAAALAARTGPS